MPILVVVVTLAFSWFINSAWLWYVVGTIAFILVFSFVYLIWYSGTPEGKKQASEETDKQLRLKEQLNLPVDFKTALMFDGKMGRMALDTDSEKVAIFFEDKWKVFCYSEINDAELEVKENGVTTTSSSRSLIGSAIGGLTFGVAGAVVGGLGGKTTSSISKTIENVTLKISVTDITTPIYKVHFGRFNTFPAKWLSTFNDVELALEWLARVKLIAERNGRKLVA